MAGEAAISAVKYKTVLQRRWRDKDSIHGDQALRMVEENFPRRGHRPTSRVTVVRLEVPSLPLDYP